MNSIQAFGAAANGLPRPFDPAAAFDGVVSWLRDLVVEDDVPGLIVGISGTDSMLAFLAAAKAYAGLGEPERVMGVHFGDPQGSWIAKDVFPWLRAQAPGAKLEIDDSFDTADDYLRWGHLFSRSVQDPSNRRAVPREDKYLYRVVDTRNATEDRLGAYTATHRAPVQPIVHLWKSEILAIGRHLGMPRLALEKSCQADCACGRLDFVAQHVAEIDAILMAQEGLIDPQSLPIDPKLRGFLEDHIDREQRENAWKSRGPRRPVPDIAIGAPPPAPRP